MSDTPEANAIIIQRGTYHLGMNTRDKGGNIKAKSEPRWEPDPQGASIAICDFNTDADETIGTADLFAWWDTNGLQNRICEKLGLTERNFPTPENFCKWMKANEDGLDICEICEGPLAGYDCRVCPIESIKTEQEDDDE